MTVEAVIIGAGGYSGAQLAGLLLAHTHVELAGLFGSERSAHAPRFGDLHPRWRGMTDRRVEPLDVAAIAALAPEAIFLATPHEVSSHLAPSLLATGAVVFDLSGAFRLQDAAAAARHYALTHADPALVARAVYGLPERHASAIAGADLVALPGCYPTASVLPLAPLAAAGAIDDRSPVVIDAVSGVSGAGRTPSARTHFCEVSLQPYAVLEHRHAPEIALHAGLGDDPGVVFTPHIAPFDRGILATIHVPLAAGWNEDRLRGALRAAYGESAFVRLLGAGEWPSVGAVRDTNFCDIGLRVDPARRHLILVSAIDNLIKGAAGQAVQCLNVRFGLPETEGLLARALEPSR
jgi:N-acetyl-gamma-glutamyl-phosphate reductase